MGPPKSVLISEVFNLRCFSVHMDLQLSLVAQCHVKTCKQTLIFVVLFCYPVHSESTHHAAILQLMQSMVGGSLVVWTFTTTQPSSNTCQQYQLTTDLHDLIVGCENQECIYSLDRTILSTQLYDTYQY